MTNVISMNLDPEALAHRATKRFEDQWVNVTELGDGGPTWNDIEENVPWGADLDARSMIWSIAPQLGSMRAASFAGPTTRWMAL